MKKLKGKRSQCGDGGKNGGCGQYFSTVHAFDRHRVAYADGSRGCLSVFGMDAIGMFQAEKGNGGLWYGSRRPLEGPLARPKRRFQGEAIG